MANSKVKKAFLSIFREILTVFIGVLIALFINDWQEKRRNERYVNSVLTAVSQDIKASQSAVEKTLERHRNTIDSIVVYLENEEYPVREIITKAGGIQYPGIKNISLRYLVGNRADLLNYQLISTLTDIEQFSNILEKKFDSLMDFGYLEMESHTEESKMMFAIHMSDVIDSEEGLLELYETFLENQDL